MRYPPLQAALLLSAACPLVHAFVLSSEALKPDNLLQQSISAEEETNHPISPQTLPFPRQPARLPAGFVAFGDSYSAGIGTGVEGKETDCRLGLGAYPQLLQDDLVDFIGENRTTFQHLSCTGARVDDLLIDAAESQIGNFTTTDTADVALLSVGGNDLGFFDIMNSCIFRFYSFYSGTCETALEKSEEALQSPMFEHKLRLAIMEILDRVQWEKRLWFTITVTGYAQFFNEDTVECDDYSFGVWWRGPKLKQKLRKRMNTMVREVNKKIRTSIDEINASFTIPRVFFVDYDAAFEGHRFCEPGVIEPDYARNETWFFLVGGPDNFNRTVGEEPPDDQEFLEKSSPLVDPNICLEAAQRSGDWGELALCMMVIAARDDPTLRTADDVEISTTSMWYVPTYYGKTFHPRTQGHMAIRDAVYDSWRKQLKFAIQIGEL